MLTAHGYRNYEISNFAKPGFECIYNTHVWNYQPYLGIGAGAHGRVCSNTDGDDIFLTRAYKLPDTYMQHAEEEGSGLFRNKKIDPKLALQERIMMGLRLKNGFRLTKNEKPFENALWAASLDLAKLQHLIDKNLLILSDSHLSLTPQGWLLLDSILNEIFTPL